MNLDFFDIFNQSPYSFYFLVVDEFLDISLPQLKNFHLIYASKNKNIKNLKNPCFCLEEQGVTLNIKNTGKLLSHPKVIDYIQKTSVNKKILSNARPELIEGVEGKPVIIPFKPSAKIEYLCRQFNWINASVSSKLNRFLEDKNQFFKFCQKYNLPTIPSKIDTFNLINFTKYQKEYGQKLVLQSHFGWAGNSTFCSDNWQGIKNSFTTDTLVKFSPFTSGYSLTNNCCLTKNGLVQSPPALQFTGIKPLTNNPFATVGRQWPSMASKKIAKKIQKITNNFSKKIAKINYLGFFGLDFLVDQNEKVFLLECNPRLTASFSFYTQIEIQKKLFPLFLLHLAQFIKISLIPKTNQIQKQLNLVDIKGTEITKKIKSKTVARYQEFQSISPKPNPINIPQQIIDQLNV